MLKMENCKISNFKGTSNQGIICLKGGGKATLADVTFENNSIVNSNMSDGVGEIFIGTSGSTLNGTTNGSITMEGNVSVYVGETFNPAPRADANSANDEVADAGNAVKIYFTKTRPENSDVVIGTDDTSLFNLQSSVYDLKGSIKNDEKRLIAVPKTQSGIAGIEADGNAPVEYYNLNGVQVKADNMTPGVYVRRQGKNVTKVIVK